MAARVLVTRAPHQASALGDALIAHGLRVVSIPTIALTPPADDYATLDRELTQLDEYDWILFTSANAVAVFAERLEDQAVPLSCGIASIGAATTKALREAGFPVRLQAQTAIAESLAKSLLPHAKGSKMLLVRAEQGRDILIETLTAAGAEVTLAPAYRSVIPMESVDRLKRELPNVHAITFTSSSAVQNLFALLDAAKVGLPPSVVLASIGPITTATLQELGHKATIEARDASVAALAVAVATALRNQA
ncbi:uroporphyrinogen-III synthase [Terriglobus roseus DSM 18391]|uniref:Uroporphyrinogen-III synthase n=1 Tax=Terriglobus roseus (strain DSM 18391 / NRRL B-41598 / KBS 63) TaxID=926566 RepID=I3ZHV1_TERRK|nr:uroporphyrinogen-III synthase [Terriglobus roseus]AFL88819.1 uroporphyrinogen-III synthase [Terriglobus roseus DSM 18391]